MNKMKPKFFHLGEYLRSKRIELGFTQQYIADKANMDVQYVSNYERGLCEPPAHARTKIGTMLKVTKKDIKNCIMKDLVSPIAESVSIYAKH